MVAPLQRVADGTTVLRMIGMKSIFIPNEQTMFPVGEAFRPNSGDEAEAKARKQPVTVSVWDRSKTTVDQAAGFHPGKPYQLLVDELRKIDGVDVVADPLDDPSPGADGHCGIVGLEKRAGETKADRKNRLDRVADLAQAV